MRRSIKTNDEYENELSLQSDDNEDEVYVRHRELLISKRALSATVKEDESMKQSNTFILNAT